MRGARGMRRVAGGQPLQRHAVLVGSEHECLEARRAAGGARRRLQSQFRARMRHHANAIAAALKEERPAGVGKAFGANGVPLDCIIRAALHKKYVFCLFLNCLWANVLLLEFSMPVLRL